MGWRFEEMADVAFGFIRAQFATQDQFDEWRAKNCSDPVWRPPVTTAPTADPDYFKAAESTRDVPRTVWDD
jgi:hypothetical protein